MLDTLKLRLTNYKIDSNTCLTVQPAPVNVSTGEVRSDFVLWDTNNGPVRGSKAYLNTDGLNVTLKPFSGEVSLFVQLSVPKAINSTNYLPVTAKEFRLIIKILQEVLKDFGIRTNVKQAYLSRLDTFRNVITDEPFEAYAPLLSLLGARRMNYKHSMTEFLWKNSQQEFAVYDKLCEMKNRKVSTSSYPPNVIRFEYRLLRNRKVTAVLGFNRLGDLLEDFGILKKCFRDAMRNDLFKPGTKNVAMLTGSRLGTQLRNFKIVKERYWKKDFLAAEGLRSLLQSFPVEFLEETFALIQGNRMAKSRVRRDLRKMRFDLALLKHDEASGKPLAKLYLELKRKVLAP